MSDGHDHTHDAVNGSVQEEQPSPIFVPPAEQMLADMRNEYGRVTVENFELKKAGEFQGRIIQIQQNQLNETMTELSKYKNDSDGETEDTTDEVQEKEEIDV